MGRESSLVSPTETRSDTLIYLDLCVKHTSSLLNIPIHTHINRHIHIVTLKHIKSLALILTQDIIGYE